MQIKKLINNNMAVTDIDGEEAIVCGRGIGYARRPGDLISHEKVEQVYRMQDPAHIKYLQELIKDTPLEDVLLADVLTTYVKKHYSKPVNETLLIVIMDHVNAARARHSKGMDLLNPMLYDIQNIYREEFEIGLQLLGIIEDRTGEHLPEDEAGFLALNIVNAQLGTDMGKVVDITDFVHRVIDVTRSHFDIPIDSDSVYYRRFLTHLKYLASRILDGTQPVGGIMNRFAVMHEIDNAYPEAYEALDDIDKLIENTYGHKLDGDERLYLLVHIATLLKAGEQGIR